MVARTPLTILGNPENRRVQGFTSAWGEGARCVSYEQLLDDPAALEGVERLRIDSPGENEHVARRLIALGGGPPEVALELGEIAYLREYHRGFCTLLERVRVPCLNAPDEIAVMFDKWRCHQRFAAAGLPRPASELAPDSFAELRRSRRSARLFLKPLHGSSASGVCALRWSGERVELVAPLTAGVKLVNNLKVRRYAKREEVSSILDQLLPQGMIAEDWIPKLTLSDGAVDLRVLVIAGEARHRVVRQSHHPMTNLHLGNCRGDEAELRDRVGEARYEAGLRLAERAAACFPRSLYAGVDILFDQAGRSYVGEINAFGDLLPGVEHRKESAYQAIARAVLQGEARRS